ncbi:hypothetical protein MARINOS108_120515 [Marinoscillum sp. 108]|nr:hypothetical protein MARINOS108_120515 [Marinoscillum sp. 108]
MDSFDFHSILFQSVGVYAMLIFSHEGFAAKFEEYPFIFHAGLYNCLLIKISQKYKDYHIKRP